MYSEEISSGQKLMVHIDCYFNVLSLMEPSCRNPWAHFQFYVKVELLWKYMTLELEQPFSNLIQFSHFTNK